MVNKKIYFFFGIVFIVVLLDQLTKQLVKIFHPFLDLKFLTIQFIKNTGAGFGILSGNSLVLGFVSLFVVVMFIIFYPQIPAEKFPQIMWALFLGGTIGNLIDRFFQGYVIDFINFKIWPAFNIADSCLTIAVVGLIVYYLKKK